MDRHILVNYCFVTCNPMDEPQNNYRVKKVKQKYVLQVSVFKIHSNDRKQITGCLGT